MPTANLKLPILMIGVGCAAALLSLHLLSLEQPILAALAEGAAVALCLRAWCITRGVDRVLAILGGGFVLFILVTEVITALNIANRPY